MKGLLVKDFRLIAGQKTFFLAMAAIAAGVSLFSGETLFAVGFLSLVAALFSLSSISYDELDNGNAFLFSLPVSRGAYAAEKYVFGLILGLAGWILSVLFVLGVNLYRQAELPLEVLMTSFALLPLVLLLPALVIPFDLKFGSERGRIAILGAFGLIFVAGMAGNKIAEKMGVDLGELLDGLPVPDLGTLIAAALGGSLLLWLLSLGISIAIVKKKEF